MVRPSVRAGAIGLVLSGLAAVPHPSQALDITEALRRAAAANPGLAARAAMADAARRRVAPAGAWAAPTVELGLVNVPTTGRFDTDPMTMRMVGVSQRVPLFGSQRLSRGAAREAAAGESAALAEAAWETFGATWEAYAEVLAAGDLVQSAAAHGGVMDRLVESARTRYQSGSGRLEDLLRAEAERARIAADLAGVRAEERGARARLDALWGVAPGESGAAGEPLARLPGERDTLGVEPWLAAVSPAHPRIARMDAEVSRYRLAGRAARRAAWPDLELAASYGWRQVLRAAGHDGAVEQDDMFSVSVGFMLPVFAGARERSEGAAMDAMARASEAERRGAELELRQEIVGAHAAAAGAGRTARLFADTVTAIQHRAVEASWAAYRAGSTDLWRILEATHALYGEEIALARARLEQARAQGRLIALTGRADLLGVALPATRSER
jgi:outer membrane protein TolC